MLRQLHCVMRHLLQCCLITSALAACDLGGYVAQYRGAWIGPLPLVCASACTMYLDTGCVTPVHRLGFHGPSSASGALSRRDFDLASEMIAEHYPPQIREAFMREWRHSARLTWIDGAEAVRLGAVAC